MPSCPTCGAHRDDLETNCPSCGAGSPLELDLARAPRAATRSSPQAAPRDVAIELAYEPAFSPGPASHGAPDHGMLPVGAGEAVISVRAPAALAIDDVAADAQALAGYGSAPAGLLASAAYAWKVVRRRRELRMALALRRDEAARAARERDDAFAELARAARPAIEARPAYAEAVEALRRAEQLVHTRRATLESENDVDAVRLQSLDRRIQQLESELESAGHAERGAAAELATARANLDREEERAAGGPPSRVPASPR